MPQPHIHEQKLVFSETPEGVRVARVAISGYSMGREQLTIEILLTDEEIRDLYTALEYDGALEAAAAAIVERHELVDVAPSPSSWYTPPGSIPRLVANMMQALAQLAAFGGEKTRVEVESTGPLLRAAPGVKMFEKRKRGPGGRSVPDEWWGPTTLNTGRSKGPLPTGD